MAILALQKSPDVTIIFIFEYSCPHFHYCLASPPHKISIHTLWEVFILFMYPVSDYGLDDWAIGVRSPVEAKDFSSSLCVQTGSEAHPASCTMGTGDPFPRGKARPGHDDHSPPSSAKIVNE
jgi:hypothetical protein